MVWTGDSRGKLAPSLVAMYAEADTIAPDRSTASDGTIASSGHHSQNPYSDHEVKDGWVTAGDITDDPDHFDADDKIMLAIDRHDPRIKYVIRDRMIFRSYPSKVSYENRPVDPAVVKDGLLPAWEPAHYMGPNPHEKHVHVSVWNTPDARDDTSPWFTIPIPTEVTVVVNDIIGLHIAYYGIIPGTEAWTQKVVASVDYHLGNYLAGRPLDDIRKEFAATVGL